MYYYIDHTSKFQYNTGIQRCVRAIAAALNDAAIPLRPLVWDRVAEDFGFAETAALSHLARWFGPHPSAWSGHRASEHWSDRWLLIVELVSGPYAPTAQQLRAAADRWGLQVAWVFHDAIPLRLAPLYGRRGPAVAQRHGRYMEGLALFERVLANSATTAHHLRTFLKARGCHSTRLSQLVTALSLPTELPGCPRPSLAEGEAAMQRWLQQCTSRPMRLLCVGSLEPRKNHGALFKAMLALQHQNRLRMELVLVGWANDRAVVQQWQRAVELNLPIRWEARADDQRLHQLYAWCDACVYPSLEEGFGLPVAESLWQRRPCLCSGEGALGELAAGGGCLTVKTSDWRSLQHGLAQLIEDPALYAALCQQLADRPMRTWRQYVDALLQDLSGHGRAASLPPAAG